MQFEQWLSKTDEAENTAQVGAFVVYLWQYGMNRTNKGNNYGTIRGKISAVTWYHRACLGFTPRLNASHEVLMRGIRRLSDPVSKRQPLTARILLRIHQVIDFRSPHGQLLWGGLLLAYFFLLRRSEYLQVDGKWHDYCLRLQHITFSDEEGASCPPSQAKCVGILLNGAKNNQYGREEQRFHHASGHGVLCPVEGARWVMKAAVAFDTPNDAPALSMGRQRGVTAKEIDNIIKNGAEAEGLDPQRFSTHSARIGGATALLNKGADRLVIKLLGRWLSNTFEEYPVLTAEGTAHISRLMC